MVGDLPAAPQNLCTTPQNQRGQHPRAMGTSSSILSSYCIFIPAIPSSERGGRHWPGSGDGCQPAPRAEAAW